MKPKVNRPKSKDILRALMDPSHPDPVPWSSNELRTMLEHQLAAPLVTEIERLADNAGLKQDRVVKMIGDSKCKTFGELLAHKASTFEMLQLVKDFAKAAMSDPEGLPRDVMRVIYISTILRGQQIPGQRMTTLDKTSINREARRCLSYGWLPDSMHSLIRNALPPS